MKQKWGERLGAGFSFMAIGVVAFLAIAICGMAVSAFVSDGLGIAIFGIGFLLTAIIMSTLNSIFVSAVYHNITGDIDKHFRKQMLDSLFVKE
jgi:hypothetical protein